MSLFYKFALSQSPAPGPYVKEMADAGTFYTNRVLKDYREKDTKHVEWSRSWLSTLTEMQAYIKKFHTTGLSWNSQVSRFYMPFYFDHINILSRCNFVKCLQQFFFNCCLIETYMEKEVIVVKQKRSFGRGCELQSSFLKYSVTLSSFLTILFSCVFTNYSLKVHRDIYNFAVLLLVFS